MSAPVPPPDPSWTDEDVEQARRQANRRSALLALLVFAGGALFAIADHLGASQPGPPTSQRHDLITACRIGAGAAFVAAFFVFFAALSAWLNLVQRRGRR